MLGVKSLEPEYMSWHDVEKATEALAVTVRDDYDPDLLVGIARGGLVPAVRLSHLLNDLEMSVIDVKYYQNVDKKMEKPKILGTDIEELEGKVLVVDDVADTGNTLQAVMEYLKGHGEGKPEKLKILTIAYKPQSKIKPDYYVHETEKWIVFPWEEAPVHQEDSED